MKPFYKRIGSKARMVKDILPLIPQHDTYVEVFLGGGSIFWGKPPSDKEILNDLDKELIADWKLIKGGTKPTLQELQAIYDAPARTKKQKLLHALIKRNNGFSSQPVKDKVYSDVNPYNKLELLPEYKARLEGVKLISQDYKKVLKTYDSPTTFFYLDPPYEESKGLYEHHTFDYEELERQLAKVKGYWMMSINDSPYIRKIFKDYIIKTIKLKGIPNTVIGGKDRMELIIMNYEISS